MKYIVTMGNSYDEEEYLWNLRRPADALQAEIERLYKIIEQIENLLVLNPEWNTTGGLIYTIVCDALNLRDEKVTHAGST